MNPREQVIVRLGSYSHALGALLALGTLAAAGCGDNSSPPDASTPPDASRPPDASKPADAGTPADSGSAPDADTPSDAGPPDASAIDATVNFSCGDFPDGLEPNDSVAAAPRLLPQNPYINPPSILAGWSMSACLSGGNDDWYRIASSTLDWHGDGGGESIHLSIRFFARNADYCDGFAICNGEQMPSAPENTVTIELYRPVNMALLATATSDFGVIRYDSGGDVYGQDFLVRVSGPPEALYDYRLSVSLTTIDGEDECEC